MQTINKFIVVIFLGTIVFGCAGKQAIVEDYSRAPYTAEDTTSVAVLDPNIPQPPSSVTLDYLSDSSGFFLDWEDSESPKHFAFNVFRAINDDKEDDSFELVAKYIKRSDYTDTDVQGGQTYHYKIVEVNTNAESSAASDVLSLFFEPFSVADFSKTGDYERAIYDGSGNVTAIQTVSRAKVNLPHASDVLVERVLGDSDGIIRLKAYSDQVFVVDSQGVKQSLSFPLPLVKGETYTFLDEDEIDGVVTVLGYETVKVPAGSFYCAKLQLEKKQLGLKEIVYFDSHFVAIKYEKYVSGILEKSFSVTNLDFLNQTNDSK